MVFNNNTIENTSLNNDDKNITQSTGSGVLTSSTNSIDNSDNISVQVEIKSEADSIADNIIAKNLKDQADDAINERVSSNNQYSDEEKIIQFINYVPGFDNYKNLIIPKKIDWYISKSIYTNINISDNINTYKKLNKINYDALNIMINQQPNL